MMIGWAYLMAALITIDAMLLGLLLSALRWPRGRKR